MLFRPRTTIPLAALCLFAAAPIPAQPQSGDEAGSSYAKLGRALEAAASAEDWGGGSLGALVKEAGHGIVLWRREENVTAAAGSAMQAITAAAALHLLGPDFRFETELLYRGAIERGRLDGDLIVRGSGDPTFTIQPRDVDEKPYAVFDAWARALREADIKRVQGGLIVDSTAFDDRTVGRGWPLDLLGDPRYPEISAVNLNSNVFRVDFEAGRRIGRTAEATLFPDIPLYLLISNHVQSTSTDNNVRRVSRDRGGRVISIAGLLPAGETATEWITAPRPPLFFGHTLKARLDKKRVKIEGGVVMALREADTERALLGELHAVAVERSPPLSEIIRRMLHEDGALEAETLFKTLGRGGADRPGSFMAGSAAVMAFLRSQGISTSGTAILDGSGRSAINRVSPRTLVELFAAMQRGPMAEAFEAAFPERRTPAPGPPDASEGETPAPATPPAARAIGGRAGDAQTLAGWVTTAGGSRVHFAFVLRGSELPSEIAEYQMGRLLGLVAASGIRGAPPGN